MCYIPALTVSVDYIDAYCHSFNTPVLVYCTISEFLNGCAIIQYQYLQCFKALTAMVPRAPNCNTLMTSH